MHPYELGARIGYATFVAQGSPNSRPIMPSQTRKAAHFFLIHNFQTVKRALALGAGLETSATINSVDDLKISVPQPCY